MKRAGFSIALFIVVFVAAYLACCYFIPGWRIKLAADTTTYFIASIKSMSFIKSLVALMAGLIAGTIPALINKRKNKP